MCTTQVTTPKHDLRAMWVASVTNIDWPSKPGLSAAQQQRELIGWLDLAVKQHHNAVVLQVRPTADAFWPSTYEPWSKYLTGTQGKDPGYDPLKFAVTEAHRRNLELHAWFNPYRITMDTTDPSTLAPMHPARLHPDWTVAYGGRLYYNPGVPQARRFVESAIMDAVRHYDIDAVHFDDYFYPYPVAGETFDDAAQYARYGKGRSLADWRRDNINTFIRELNRQVKGVKPHVQLGVSPFAIWRNKATDPQGSDTTAGVETYDDLYADTRMWVRTGLIDYIAPQVYWSRGFAAADYEKVTSWWAEQAKGTRVHLYIGQATYKVAQNADPAWDNPGELSSHLEFNTHYPHVDGNMYFSAVQVSADRLGATSLLNETWYSRPALVPASPWLDTRRGAPTPVQWVKASHRQGSNMLQWKASRASDTASYAIYAVPGHHVRSCDLADARHLVATVRAMGQVQRWTEPDEQGDVTYVVTPVDRTGNEASGTIAD